MKKKTGRVRFTVPYVGEVEHEYLAQVLNHNALAGNGPFARRCEAMIKDATGCEHVYLTHSATGALEMAALLLDLEPGDEVIMPSFTFVSTANAVVLRGAVPVFVDIRADTMNIDESLLEDAITGKTKAIIVVHYGGIACSMNEIRAIAEDNGVRLIEDAAQGFDASYENEALGTLGDMGVFSFHETKNITCGEGGALLVNDSSLKDRAEMLWEKGTDRSKFFRGEIDKYTWQDVGSSFQPSELQAAFLLAQLQKADEIRELRVGVWQRYFSNLAPLAERGLVKLPTVPDQCTLNGHLFYVVAPSAKDRDELLAAMKARGVNATFHYVPLHSSPAGLKYGTVSGSMENTDRLSARLVRLPLWPELGHDEVDRICEIVTDCVSERVGA